MGSASPFSIANQIQANKNSLDQRALLDEPSTKIGSWQEVKVSRCEGRNAGGHSAARRNMTLQFCPEEPLKVDPEAELDQPRIVHLRNNGSEIHCVVSLVLRGSELRVVEGIEEFRAELHGGGVLDPG
jgi:hypothetical protein